MTRFAASSIAIPLLATTLCLVARAQEDGVPVVIDGQEIVRIYGPLGPISVPERARAIEDRILMLSGKRFSARVGIRPMPLENATAVVVGALVIMTVTELDAEPAGLPSDQLAARYAVNIQQAIETYRLRHTWSNFLLALLKTAAAWCAFWFGGWAFWKGINNVRARLEQRFRDQAVQLAAGGFSRFLLERGRPLVTTALAMAAAFAILSTFSFVLSYTFGLYPQTAGISTTLWDYIASIFRAVANAMVGYLPSGGLVVVTIIVTFYLLRLLKSVADAVERGDLSIKGIHPEMARPTFQLTRLLLMIIAFIVAFPYLPGGNSDAFKGVSLFIGLLLSLGSSSAVSNVLAGLVLTYMRPYHGGDRVKIADTVGDIVEKSLLVTRVRTIKNVEVVIPNSAILSNQIHNYSALSRSRGLILNTTVTIGYDASWRAVHDLLRQAALDTDGILHDPPPFVFETSLNDFHVSYELNAYTDRANDIQEIYSHLHEAIQDRFNCAGVEIMSPAYHSLRDGNTVTIPRSQRPAGYEPPRFHVSSEANASRAGGSA
jgi:small-conductance mechanosensitive channel